MVYRIPHFWTEKYDKSCSLLSWQPGKIWQMQRATNVPSRRENARVLAKEAHLRLQKWQGYRHSGRVPYVKLHHWNLIHTVASQWHVCFRGPQGFLRQKTRVPVRKGRRCKRLKTRTLTPSSKMIAGIVISTRIEHYLDVHSCMWVNCYFTIFYMHICICISYKYQASDSHFLGMQKFVYPGDNATEPRTAMAKGTLFVSVHLWDYVSFQWRWTMTSS